MKITKQVAGKDIEVDVIRRSDDSVLLSASGLTFVWSPEPKPGRTPEKLRAEFDSAVETFVRKLAERVETAAHLDTLFPPEESS